MSRQNKLMTLSDTEMLLAIVLPLPTMINSFDIQFEVDGLRYTATVENYLYPGQIRVTNIIPVPKDFPAELIFDKNHLKKTLLYEKGKYENAVSQIIEAIHYGATTNGFPLYLGEQLP